MNRHIIFYVAAAGVLTGLVSAYIFGRVAGLQPPVFIPASSPYASAIFANGIIESAQSSGSNVSMYPEVSGTITQVLVQEGQAVMAGTLLMRIDSSVQAGTTEQLRLQSEAALVMLHELQAQPRKEVVGVAVAQEKLAVATFAIAQDQYIKRRDAYALDRGSISRDLLDTAHETAEQAEAAVAVAHGQLALTNAGAWSFDIESQEKQYKALVQGFQAARALLAKYEIVAPVDGVVMSLNAGVGSFISPQGTYNPYTQLLDPLIILGAPQRYLDVRCYVDEILVTKLPEAGKMRAQMSIRGSDLKIDLEFVRIQPYVSPKIELSNQRQEQVDLRVLPVIFRFLKQDAPVYPGQLVDVFIGNR